MDDYDYYDYFGEGYGSSGDLSVGRGLENLDLGILDQYGPTFDFGRGEGPVDLSSFIGGGYGIDPYLGFGGELTFDTDEGGRVIYTPEGMVQTTDPSGRNAFYLTNEGRDYFVDYADINTPGSFIETFNRAIGGEGPTGYGAYHTTDGRDYFIGNEDVYTPGSLYEIFSRATGGEGPTRYTAYSGLGKDAKVVDYSDVYGPGGGRITTTGGDGKQTIYQDGKVTTNTIRDTNTIKEMINRATGGKDNTGILAALLGGLLSLLAKNKGKSPTGYQGVAPKYTAQRRPGQGTRLIQAAEGGLMDLAQGGTARYLRGGTDGMADKIQTDIDGKQPARLSHGEFVIPADVVSHLGNGNSEAGADVLYDMMAKVRKARTGTKKQGKQINPRKYTPV